MLAAETPFGPKFAARPRYELHQWPTQALAGHVHEVGGLAVKMQVSGQRRYQHVSGCTFDLVPPAGFEPALTAAERLAVWP